MQREMDLVRAILFRIESEDEGKGEFVSAHIAGYSIDQTTEHLFLLHEAGLIEGRDVSSSSGRKFWVRRLTWDGHDFLDSVRDNEIWQRTKEGALAAGGFSVDLLKDLSKGFLRKQISEKTGISL